MRTGVLRRVVVVGVAVAAVALVGRLAAASSVSARNGRIVFVTYRDASGRRVLQSMNPDGSDKRYLAYGFRPTWNWNGTQLLYATRASDGGYLLVRANTDGRRLGRVKSTCQDHWSGLDWSVRGRPVLVSDPTMPLQLMSPNCRSLRSALPRQNPLARVDHRGFPAHSLVEARWSPDGSRIAFETRPLSRISANQVVYALIYVMDANGDNLRQVSVPTSWPGASYGHSWWTNEAPTWSPDGTHLAYIETHSDRTSDVLISSLDRAPPVSVYSARNAVDVVWSPDGTRLAVLTGDGLLVMNADGSHPRKIAPNPYPIETTQPVSWQPIRR